MIKGITPIDASFETMGLVQAHGLLRFLFVETLIGKAIFALGFVLALRAVWAQGTLKPLAMYALVFFTLWFLVILPRGRSQAPQSATGQSVSDLLNKHGYTELWMTPALDWISTATTAMIVGTIKVIDRMATPNRKFLEHPFFVWRTAMETRQILRAGITSDAYREKLAQFLQENFWPALRALKEQSTDTTGFWPGHREMLAHYTPEARTAWQELRDGIYGMCNTSNVFSTMFKVLYDGNEDKDAVVREVLSTEFHRNKELYVMASHAMRKKYFLQNSTAHDIDGRELLTWDVPRFVLNNAFALQGLCLFSLYVMTPAVVAGSILLRQLSLFGVLLLALGMVKSWSLMWAMTSQAADFLFLVLNAQGHPMLWNMGAISVLSALSVVLFPLMWCVFGIVMIWITITRRS